MIELVPQLGERTLRDGSKEQVPLDFDRVYRTRNGRRELLGYVWHAPGSAFVPAFRLAQHDLPGIVSEVNRIRGERGLSTDTASPTAMPPREEDVEAAMQSEEEDDE